MLRAVFAREAENPFVYKLSDSMADPATFALSSGGVRLAGEAGGEGPPIVLLHGLTATRRYVLMGSRLLERTGYRLISFDARGHGQSSPAPEPSAYEYTDMVADLEVVLDQAGADRAVLAGSSMGAATAIAFFLAHPERVAALVQITPAYAGHPHDSPEELEFWTALSDGLERGGVDGFLDAYRPLVGGPFADRLLAFTRQRLERHSDLGAVADALRVVPGSSAFEGLDVLDGIDRTALVVGSRDEADPGHPLAVARAYAERLPRAELIVEDEGQSPIAWRGAKLSRAIAGFLERAL
jgi:pimeloyl-ACP methyl ester carboxylesterase